MTARDLSASLNAGGTLPPRVSVVGERIGSLIFYLSPSLRRDASPARVGSVSLAEAVSRIRTDPPDAVIAIRNDQLERFERLFSAPPAPTAQAGTMSVFRVGTLQPLLTGR
jgi:hypothetical protein